jgi:nucleoside-diphosphate-sugar epimerase
MVYIDNLVTLINRVIESQAMGTFVAGDAVPVATDELITLMRKNMGRKQDLLSVPAIFRGLLKMVRPSLHTRLFGSFIVDNTVTNKTLSFSPPVSTEDGVAEMVKWYQQVKT